MPGPKRLTCDGDTTHQPQGRTGTTKLNYVYDYGDRLREVRDDSDYLVASYEYDALNRRVRKTVFDDDSQESPTELSGTWFLWDGSTGSPQGGWRAIEERDRNDSDAVLRRYVYGATYIDDHVAMLVPDPSAALGAGGEGGWDVYSTLQDRMAPGAAAASQRRAASSSLPGTAGEGALPTRRSWR